MFYNYRLREKPKNTMPTPRQMIAVAKLSELIGKSKGKKRVSFGKILREAGYSEKTSLTPANVTASKGFQQLISEMIPDCDLAKKNNELLNAKVFSSMRVDLDLTAKQIRESIESNPGFEVKNIIRKKKAGYTLVYFNKPDTLVADRALDKLYKIQGHYAPQEHKVENTFDVVEVTNYGDKDK
jgi:hypothetical protein